MSEHQEVIAALSALIMEQRRTTEALERLLGEKPDLRTREDLQKEIAETVTPEPTPEPEQVEKSVTPTLEDLKQTMMDYSKKTNREKAKELLAEFGVKKLTDVAPEDRAALIAKATGV